MASQLGASARVKEMLYSPVLHRALESVAAFSSTSATASLSSASPSISDAAGSLMNPVEQERELFPAFADLAVQILAMAETL